MLFFGLICGGRSALTWAAVHRIHHSTSDTEDDPHSPIYKGIWKVVTSSWQVEYIPKKYIVDLLKNPRVVFFHRYRKHIHLTYAAVMLLIGIKVFIIFVFMPYILAWLSFGLLNWTAHKDGEPRNVPIMNLLAPGEGWHKTHHEEPRASKLHTYDIAGIIIDLLQKIKH
jgi:stearoyl-CoA desaturase (delta-9 desaturase)